MKNYLNSYLANKIIYYLSRFIYVLIFSDDSIEKKVNKRMRNASANLISKIDNVIYKDKKITAKNLLFPKWFVAIIILWVALIAINISWVKIDEIF